MNSEGIQYLAIDQIECDPQVRQRFDEQPLIGLARSIQEVGLQQPIRVRRVGSRLVVVDGERRLRACRLAKRTEVAVIVEEKELGEGELLQRQLIANVQRASLTAGERARGLKRLIDLTGWPIGEAAGKCGVSSATATRWLAILDLPQAIQDRIDAGDIPESAGYLLKRVADPATQEAVAAQIAEGQLTRDSLMRSLDRKPARRRPQRQRGARRVTAVLGGGVSVTLTGAASTLSGFIEAMESALSKAKQAREQGIELKAFIRALRAEAYPGDGNRQKEE